jgi:group II intron reverse transcriptase/maturase
VTLKSNSGGRKAAMHERSLKSEQSDEPILPAKLANAAVTPAESVEGRGEANGKLVESDAVRAQDRSAALARLRRVGERATKDKETKFNNLLTLICVPLLREAYEGLRKDAASGVDGMTWREYGEELEARLADLNDRIHRGGYRAPPVRRVYIPKADGRRRPLGIPALEDKIVQLAVKWILESIYEPAFMGFSYGFRAERNQHAALDALAVAIGKKVSWVLDGDIQAFFDTVDHAWMNKFLEHRIADRRMVRLLMKWLRAGVMEDGKLHDVEEGTPQGGIVSPVLANIYLHYVLDLWADSWRKKHAHGETYIVRYADDFVMCFQHAKDAHAMRKALADRLAKFGLALHPEKTRVIRFGRFALDDCKRDGRRRPETFDFLGFTHIIGRSRAGASMLMRRTSRKKRQAKMRALLSEIHRRKHWRVRDQQRWLNAVLRGHYNYYGVPTNIRALQSFRRDIENAWHRSLQRRSQRARWTRAQRRTFQEKRPLLPAKIYHPWPSERFAIRQPKVGARCGKSARRALSGGRD